MAENEPIQATPAKDAEAAPAASRRRTLQGVVVSDKMDKTVVVQVTRRYKHKVFQKYVSRRLKYKAHDEKNLCGAGDEVLIMECRPLSREKRWTVKKILKKAV